MMDTFFSSNPDVLDTFPNFKAFSSINSPNVDSYLSPMRQLIQSNELSQVVAKVILQLHEGRNRMQLQHHVSNHLWRLSADDYFILSVRDFSPLTRNAHQARIKRSFPLVLQSNDVVYAVVGPGHVVFDYYRSSGDQTASLIGPEERTLRHGDLVCLKTARELADIKAVHPELIMVELVSRKHDTIVWQYDRQTLRPVQAASSDMHAARLHFLVRLLEKLHYEPAISDLVDVFHTSSFYFVRWSAVKTALRLNFATGVALLEKACGDEHPRVSHAARALRSRLQQAGLY